MHVVVGRTHIGRIGIRQPPLFGSHIYTVTGHHIVATRLKGRDTLRKDKRFIGEVLRYIFHPLMVVVETDDVNGTAFEKMVIGRGFVTACGNGARCVIALHNLCEMLGEQ